MQGIISWSINSSKKKTKQEQGKFIISLSSSEEDQKVQSAEKKYSWKKMCTVNVKTLLEN